MSKEFFEVVNCVGASFSYLMLTEANFASASGSAYVPPERGDWKRLTSARQIQLLQDCPGVVETFQTTAATVFLPCNSIGVNNDAGDGRIFWFKNSGSSSVTIKDYVGTDLWVVKQYAIVVIVGNDNNQWDFYFTAKNIFYDNTISGLISENVKDAIDELNSTGGVSASPGFTWGSSGSNVKGSYLLNETVPSNVAGRVVPLNNGSIREIFVANEISTTFTINIEKRTGPGTFTVLTSATVVAARNGTFVVDVAVSKGDELAARISPSSANAPKNTVCGIIIKGSTV